MLQSEKVHKSILDTHAYVIGTSERAGEMETAEYGDAVNVNLLGLYASPVPPENGKSHAISKF